ncbi:MAG: hypothetical protein CMI23_04450 [Opitutae bacterium]|nr:hypothetical protein [Opitutae bacterium]|tara:strand:+ start:579 stop:1565 length:987 start_codon:yes stop_codon:yes gene_type:complete
MNLYVSRDGQTFGPYTVDQAKEFLHSGQLLASDFALYEGESEWKSLGVLLGQNERVTTTSIGEFETPTASVKAVKKQVSGSKKRQKVRVNRAQSSVVIKEKGLFSKLFSIAVVFCVTCILVIGIIAGLYFAMPTKVAPILAKFGLDFEKPSNDENLSVVSNVTQEPISPIEKTLSDEELHRLRSSNIILLWDEKGKGFRILSPADKDQGLNDDDLEALIPISNEILTLDLTHAEISDKGISIISKFTNLQRLYLEGNKAITSRGLTNLKDLKNVNYLNLVRVDLDDSLVDVLIAMENLREIYLFESGLSEDSISRLTNERPKVFVNRG